MLPTFDIPPVGPIQGKVWGTTQLLFAHNGTECHRIQFKTGGWSSIHTHKFKWNRFVGISGSLEIEIHRENGVIDSTIVGYGGVTDVPPGVAHRFRAIDGGQALEFYWTTLDAQDIERRDQGGIDDDS